MALKESTSHLSVRDGSWTRAGVIGLVGGMAAAMMMAGYAMVAGATYQGTGLFTPLYHIGSAFGSAEASTAMEASMERAVTGDLYHFVGSPAALGMAIHLFTGAAWGTAFGLLVRGLRVTRAAIVPAGVVFGLGVMIVMAFAVLPAVATTFDSGAPIRDMATMVGWGTFNAEHAIFGFAVGLAALAIAPRAAAAPAEREDRSRPLVTDRRVHA